MEDMFPENRRQSEGAVVGKGQAVALEQISQWYQQVSDRSFKEIYVFGADDLHFIEANETALIKSGYSLSELRSYTPLDITHHFSQTRYKQILSTLRSGRKTQTRLTTALRHKDGGLHLVEAQLQFADNFVPPVFIAALQDVTGQHISALLDKEKARIYEKFVKGASLAETAKAIVKSVGRVWPGLYCAIWAKNFDTDEMELVSVESRIRTVVEGLRVGELIVASGESSLPVKEDRTRPEEITGQEDIASSWLYPVYDSSGDVLGVMLFASQCPYELTDEQLAGLQVLVDLTGLVINHKQSIDSLHVQTAAYLVDLSVERTHALEVLKKNKERFDLAMKGANDGLWDWDLTTNELYFSPRWKSMLGYENHELPNAYDSWKDHLHPDDMENAINTVQGYFNSKDNEFSIEFKMRHKEGHYVDILSRGFAKRDADGKLQRIVGTHVDVSRLKAAEEKCRAFFDSTNDAVILLDKEVLLDCNPATLKMFGIATVEDFRNLQIADLSPKTQPNSHNSQVLSDEHIAKAFENGRNSFEWLCRRSSGDSFPAEVSLTPMQLSGNAVLYATVRDITERKEAENLLKQRLEEIEEAHRQIKEAQAQLLQSEKLASIGQLAAGVAHEINNPVGYVSSNISALSSYIGDLFKLLSNYESLESVVGAHAVVEEIETIKKELDIDFLKEDIQALISESQEGVVRVREIVQDLKDFSHVDATEWHYSDIQKGLESTLNIVHNELKYKAEVVREFSDMPEVECMLSQLNQVFMNLLVNAGHAIEESGKVFVRTGLEGDDKIFVEIEDSGSGIEPENLKHIFDPFFTTKEVGKGTGLGLSIVYGIIERHHGNIDVRSEIGKGTCFRVTLPIVQPEDDENAS